MLGLGQIGNIVKGIGNAGEHGGGLKGAMKGIGKAVTGGDTDDKLDAILTAVTEKQPTASKILQPSPQGAIQTGSEQNANIPDDLTADAGMNA